MRMEVWVSTHQVTRLRNGGSVICIFVNLVLESQQ